MKRDFYFPNEYSPTNKQKVERSNNAENEQLK